MLNFRKLKNKAGLMQAYKTVFCADEKAGQKVLDDLVTMSGFVELSYTPGRDAATVAFREGQKSVINHILTHLHYDEDYIGRINMLLEIKEQQTLNQEY